MEYTVDEKREAFASFGEYLPRFKATMAEYTPGIAHERTLLDNPLVSLIYADAFLAGRHTGDKPEGVKQLRQKVRDHQAMIEELLWVMHLWSRDEDDTIHPDAWSAFDAAMHMIGVKTEELESREGFRFTDPDWVQRQREQWQRRQETTDYPIGDR